jgi:hypothetical protein
MVLINLVYVSSAATALNDNELKLLLENSRVNNERDSITGMLLYRNEMFIQAIEGDYNDIHRLYSKIRADPRHHSVMCVEVATIEERSFSNWTMGFSRLDESDLSSIPGYTSYLQQPFRVKNFVDHPNRAKVLLAQFRERTAF